jgi:hypothetical protein
MGNPSKKAVGRTGLKMGATCLSEMSGALRSIMWNCTPEDKLDINVDFRHLNWSRLGHTSRSLPTEGYQHLTLLAAYF